LSSTNENRGVARYPLPGVPTPILDADIPNKAYVDAASVGLLEITQSVDQTVNNSTVLVDSELIIPVLAGRVYSGKLILFVNSSAVADFAYGISFSGAITDFLRPSSVPTFRALSNTTATVTDNMATNGTNQSFVTFFKFRATVAGNCRVQFAQNNLEVSDTDLLAGSSLKLIESA